MGDGVETYNLTYMTKIKSFCEINYKDDAEGTLLFTALSILTTDVYPDKTPDEVVDILNEKSKWWDKNDCGKTEKVAEQ